MDFNDILKDFETTSRSRLRSDDTLRAEDLQALTQAWIQERTIPEVLPYEEDLLERILERMRKQIEFIELNSIELQKHEREIKLLLVIVESELDRVQFLIRSYVRTRLMKIDQFSVYIRSNEQELKKLSGNETVYMERHLDLLMELYNRQFLKNLPESLQALDEGGGLVHMVEKPDLHMPVFVKCGENGMVMIEGEEVELEKEGIYVMRYSAVKELVKMGSMIVL
ncbi:unnamed protein product [Ambrosiozyma monospora]|uniref:Unnamed protein product n=1 Tax=Ambrosiozyma monospora TaxID=43982 RepID=A0ACB5T4G2_AMBMO|nr:unnamed protein product [Ambrosiozyma monospora]